MLPDFHSDSHSTSSSGVSFIGMCSRGRSILCSTAKPIIGIHVALTFEKEVPVIQLNSTCDVVGRKRTQCTVNMINTQSTVKSETTNAMELWCHSEIAGFIP